MDHNALMLECLKLATSQGYKGEECRLEAERMFAQILGRSPREGKEPPLASAVDSAEMMRRLRDKRLPADDGYQPEKP